ncbi:MAG: UPF0182 family protein [Brevinema sp.]
MNKNMFLLTLILSVILGMVGMIFFSNLILDIIWYISQGFVHTVVRFLVFKWMMIPIFAMLMLGLMFAYLITTTKIPKEKFPLLKAQLLAVFIFSLVFEWQTRMTQHLVYALLAGMTGKQDLLTNMDFSVMLFWFPLAKNATLYFSAFFIIPVIFSFFQKKFSLPKLSTTLSVCSFMLFAALERLDHVGSSQTNEYMSFMEIYGALWPFAISLILAFSFFILAFWIFPNNSKFHLLGGGTLAGIVFILNTILPYALDNFVYKPNKSSYQIKYAGVYADTTRKAFDLDSIIRGEDFLYTEDDLPYILQYNFWNDEEHFVQSVQKNQEILPIFRISDASATLLTTEKNTNPRPMFIASRNIIENERDDWDIRHFRNIFGYGAVIGSASEFDYDGNPRLYLKDLTSHSSNQISLAKPQIFFNDSYDNFVFLNSSILIPDFSKEPSPLVAQKFDGVKGIKVNFFIRLLMAVVYGDHRFFLTDYISEDTTLLLKRKPSEIVETILPMFHFSEPSLIMKNGELWWALDGYSTSDNVFLSKKVETPWGKFNWVRSPIKAYLSAYSGELVFEIMDQNDPHVRIVKYLFPKLFDQKAEFPLESYQYPKLLFDIQSSLLTRFHDSDPASFYAQLNIHEISRPLNSTNAENIKNVFLRQTNRIAYQHTYTPKNKNIFSARLLGFVDGDKNYKLHYYISDYGYGIAGLAQAEAFLNQDQEFSSLTTLWDQRGSKVSSSDTVFYPMKDKGIYLRTVFLESEGISIPLATRFVAMNNAKAVVKEQIQDLVNSVNTISQTGIKKQSAMDQLKAVLLESYQYYIQAQSAKMNGNVQEYNENVDKIGKALQNAEF